MEALCNAAPDMTPEVQRAVPVALALGYTARADGTRASMSGPRLTQLLSAGHTDRTVLRHLAALRDAGWIVQTERGGRRGRKQFASVYRLTQPATAGRLEGVGQPATDGGLAPDSQPATADAPTRHSLGSPLLLTGAVRRTSGARSADAARDPVRQAELETWWAQAESGGPALVLDWTRHYVTAAGHEQAVAWLCAAAFYDLDEHGVPDSGDVDVDRVVWLACVLAEVKPDRVDCWTPGEIEQAATAAMSLGLDEAEAFAALTYLAADDATAGTPPRTPAELPRLLKKTRTDPYARIALREARQWLAEWQQVTAARRVPTITEETA